MSAPQRHWALVLGASSGTGAAAAYALAKAPGLDVFGVHRGNHPESAAKVQEEVETAGGRCHWRVADAATHEGVVAGAEEIAAVAGPRSVAVVVHALACGSFGHLAHGHRDTLRPRQFHRTFDAMAHSFVWWAQELAARDLLAPGARLIGLTNPIVHDAADGFGLISASKAALAIYVRHLSLELAPLGHRTMLVEFGLVDTPAIRLAFPGGEWERVSGEIAGATPSGRLCTVEEVGDLLSALAGRLGDWFNGATIDFTGGQTRFLLDTIFHPEGRDDTPRNGGREAASRRTDTRAPHDAHHGGQHHERRGPDDGPER